MTDEPPSPPADEPVVPLEPSRPDPAAEWPGFPPSDTPVPWAAEVAPPADDPELAPVVAPPATAPEHSRLRMWVAVGIGLQVLALLLWAYFVL